MLEDNFREIYQTIKFPSELTFPLVANLQGTRLYDSRYGWGRLWYWFYQIVDGITGNDWHLNKLKKAVLHTHTLFQHELSQVQTHQKSYLEYLDKSGKGYDVPESAYFPARRIITKWNASTKPFLKLVENSDAVKHLMGLLNLETAVKDDKVVHDDTFSFHSPYTSSIHSCQKIIDLEGAIGGPLPLVVLKKIIRNIPLNTLDQKDLDRWIAKINKNKLEAKSVHKALHSLLFQYTKKSGEQIHQKNLTELELFLEDKGCKVFQKQDLKHLKWRQGLETGCTLTFNQSEIVLGEELFSQRSGSDQTRAYAVEGQMDRVALIAQNCIVLALRDLRLRKENDLGMEPAVFLNISSDGRIALMERLKPLNSIQWTSANGTISQEDSAMVNRLSSLIQGFIKQDFTTANFSPSILMFNDQLELKFLKPLTKHPFDFNAIEDFILDCSAGNITVFQELMAKSGLLNHQAAKFYRSIVSNALNEDTTAPDDMGGIYKISDPKIVDRAIALTGQINSLKERLKLQLRPQHSKLLPRQLNDKINQMIYTQYLQHKTAGTLWPL